ncbi:UdgX family uracil-DNA binding protein [Actinomycetospora sp. TBRC 11914]|uniref:UdgX family uracil-DNA binding protein n=1 Tax=Actinomycetospora sp. TBRC 11914 TaxID=2729387 RepID=UPI00145ED080|nr:UdgX family uracil-DNA binding protein [Actinomycetospora sp. TBRC 11914]NMO89552.1 UdgX family uracil-DNA binding protein [Actinomycetospora sp. TBRC 11914]
MTEPLDLFSTTDDADTPGTVADATAPTEAPDLETLRERAAACTACELHEGTTGTVFGVGPTTARVMFVGEQPGDQEDRKLEPFVGPAGRLLDEALVEAGIAREDAYVTNAVKHFSFRRQGNRRIHQTPKAGHIRACRPWLDGELALVRPHVLVTLGATAGKALLGSSFRITAERGQPRPWEGSTLVPTIHPSAILRADPDRGQDADEMRAGFVEDLRTAAQLLD